MPLSSSSAISTTPSVEPLHQVHVLLRACAARLKQAKNNPLPLLENLHLVFEPAHARLRISSPHHLFAHWLDAQLPAWRLHLAAAARELCGTHWSVVWDMDPPASGDSTPATTPCSPSENGQNTENEKQEDKQEYPYGESYTLTSFLANTKNHFPVSVLHEAAAKNPAYRLLVLYGASGTGKTHLVRALGNALSISSGNAMIFCGSLDDLADIATGTLHDAYRRLTGFQALLIDDMDRLPFLPQLIDVIPLVIEHCLDQGKLFLCTTRQHPSTWGDLPQLVRVRLDQALIMGLHEADMDIRLRYAQANSQRLRLHLGRTQLLTLARQCTNLRRLMGVLQRLAALRDLIGHDISAQDMERALSHTADTGVMTPQLIVRVTAVRYGVRPEDVFGTSRRPKAVRARQVAMYLCRELLGNSYPALGRIFGNRDHSTVIHAFKKIQQLRDNDKDTHNLVAELLLTCRQTAK